MSDIFLSYATDDRDRVRPLVEQLEARGYTVWSDTRIGVGSSFDREIQKQLDAAACVLVVWSELSVESEMAVTASLDEDLILQLLLNLLDNAIKYTESGGSVVTGWNESEGGARIWVRDSGLGIPAEHLARVFDRFYRVDKARSRTEGGAGLGLSISRWIAEAHDATLTIESEPGRGTTVELAIPGSRIAP